MPVGRIVVLSIKHLVQGLVARVQSALTIYSYRSSHQSPGALLCQPSPNSTPARVRSIMEEPVQVCTPGSMSCLFIFLLDRCACGDAHAFVTYVFLPVTLFLAPTLKLYYYSLRFTHWVEERGVHQTTAGLFAGPPSP